VPLHSSVGRTCPVAGSKIRTVRDAKFNLHGFRRFKRKWTLPFDLGSEAI